MNYVGEKTAFALVQGSSRPALAYLFAGGVTWTVLVTIEIFVEVLDSRFPFFFNFVALTAAVALVTVPISVFWAVFPARIAVDLIDRNLTIRRGDKIIRMIPVNEIEELWISPSIEWPDIFLSIPPASLPRLTIRLGGNKRPCYVSPRIALFGRAACDEAERDLKNAVAHAKAIV